MTQKIPSNMAATSKPMTGGSEVDGADLARTIAEATDDRKALDVVILKVSDVSYLADYFVIATGLSLPQIRAIANHIQQSVSDTWERSPTRVEGQSDGNWVLIDYGDVIAHLFLPDERDYYGLEAFWGHAEQIPFESSQP